MKDHRSNGRAIPGRNAEGDAHVNKWQPANDGMYELCSQLSEALELIDECHTRGVEISRSFLDYTEQLMGEIEILHVHAGKPGTGHC